MPEGVSLAEMLRPLSAPRSPQPPAAKPTETRNDDSSDAFRGALDDAVANRPQPHQKPAKPADAPAGDSRPETEQASVPATDDSSKPQIPTDEAAAMTSTQTQVTPGPVVAPVVAPVIAATEPVVVDSPEQTATTESVGVASRAAKQPAKSATEMIAPPVIPLPRDDAKPNVQATPLPPNVSDDASTTDQAEPVTDSAPVDSRKLLHDSEQPSTSQGRDLKIPNTGPHPEKQAVSRPVPTRAIESVSLPDKPIRHQRHKHIASQADRFERPVDGTEELPPRTSKPVAQPESGRTTSVRGRNDKSHAPVRAVNPFVTTEAGNLNWQEVDSVSPAIRTGSGDSPAAGIARFLIESDAGSERGATVNPSGQDATQSSGISTANKHVDVGRGPTLSGSTAIESRTGVSQFLVSQSRAAETLEQAARVLASGGNGRYQVTMHLDPPDLGRLRLDVQMADQIMTLRVDADSQQVANLIESKLSHLRDSLAQHGIRIDRSEIAVRQSAGAEGGNTSQDSSQNQSSNRESQSGSSHDSSNWTAGQFAREGRERDASGQGGFGSNFDDDSFALGIDSAAQHLAPVGAYSGDSRVDVLV
jgi:flagellar hook-length control protein FliK